MSCGCGSDCCADNVKGKTGPAGTSKYVYIGYALDASGAGFSLIPNDNLEYIQMLVLDSAVTSLTVADFTGVWVKYIGDYGGNSDDFLFSASLSGDPGSGKLLFDNANVSAATKINVSVTDLGGFNVASWLSAINIPTSGIKAFVRVFKNDINKAFFAVTGYAAVGGTHVELTVQPLALTSNSPFSADDKVILSFCNTGDKGDTGPTGISQGTSHNFSNATTSSDPGLGNLNLNNADTTLATVLYINKTDNNSANVAAYIALAGASSNTPKAYVKIGLKSDESKFAFYSVTSVVSLGAYYQVNLNFVASSGAAPFPNTEEVAFIVSVNGDAGANSNTVLFNDLVAVDSGNTSNVLTLVKNHDIPANTLQNDGDSVRVQVLIQCMDNHANANLEYAQVEIDGTNVAGLGNHLNYLQSFILNISIDRLTSTSYMVSCFWTPTLTSVAQDCLIVTGANFAAALPIDVLVANTINTPSTDAYMTVRKIFAEYKPV